MASWNCIRIVPALACCLRAPNHYLNQCWLVVHRSLSNKLQRNFNQNAKISMQEYVFCKMSSILLKCQCGNNCVAHMPVSMHWQGMEWCYSYTKSGQLLWVTQRHVSIITLRPRQHGRHFADYTFKRIFLNENAIFWNKIALKFVPKGPINNIPALVQIMAWRRPGDKPLSEAMMVSLLTHICATRPQWVIWHGICIISPWCPTICIFCIRPMSEGS